MTADVNTDLRHPDNVVDPHPTYAWLRRERPVFWSEAVNGWVLTRYDDIETVARSKAFSVEKLVAHAEGRSGENRAHMEGIGSVLSRWSLFRDAPAHTRLRRPLNTIMRRAELERIRPRLVEIVHACIDEVAHAGRMELIADFAFPLPATAIALLLGVPVADTEKLRKWSVEVGTFVLFSRSAEDRYARAHRALDEMQDYFVALTGRYRSDPQPCGIATLLGFSDPEGPFGLSDEEIAAAAMLLLFAGHETTTNLIANGMYALLHHPDQLDRLAREPDLIPSAVEEFLRFESPAQTIIRIALEETTVGGQQIRAGDRVYAVLLAANRDPAHFQAPQRLDIGRGNNGHMAFGHGMHFCVGAPLARLEAQIAFEALLARLTDFALDGDAPEWDDHLITRALKALPITFRARVGA